MTDDDTDPDAKLRARIADELGLKSEPGDADTGDETAEQKGDYEDDDEMDEEAEGDTPTTSETKMGMDDAVSAIADEMDDDVSAEDVMDLLEPIMGEAGEMDDDDEDEMDEEADDGELKAEDVKEIVGATLDAKLDERLDGVVTESDLSDIESKLDDRVTEARLSEVVTTIGDEVEATMQKAEVGTTPSPTSGGSDRSPEAILFGGDDE